MQSRPIIILATVTAIAVAMAALALSTYRNQTRPESQARIMYPDLVKKAADIGSITISTERSEVHLERAAEGWQVAERHGFPADGTKIANALRELAAVELREPRSDNPELFDRLHLRPAGDKGSRAKAVRVETESSAVADLLLGKVRHSAGTGPRQFFTRRADEDQSWLAEGSFDPSDNPQTWLQKTILDIDQKRVQRLEISHPDGDSSVISRSKPGDDFALENPPDGREVNAVLVNSATFGVQGLPLNDVHLASEQVIEFVDPLVARYQTFDGLTVWLEVASAMDAYYLRLRAGFDPSGRTAPIDESAQTVADSNDAITLGTAEPEEAAQSDPEADAEWINRNLGRWVFLIPPHTADTFSHRRDEFLQELPDAEQ